MYIWISYTSQHASVFMHLAHNYCDHMCDTCISYVVREQITRKFCTQNHLNLYIYGAISSRKQIVYWAYHRLVVYCYGNYCVYYFCYLVLCSLRVISMVLLFDFTTHQKTKLAEQGVLYFGCLLNSWLWNGLVAYMLWWLKNLEFPQSFQCRSFRSSSMCPFPIRTLHVAQRRSFAT